MFAIDDRTGNIVTTVAVFLIAGLVLYLARGAFFILLLSLLFAYLLEPAVALAQRRFRLGPKNRIWAIVLVYLIGTLVLGVLGYAFGPHLATQVRSFKAALPQILQGLYSGKTAADLGARHGLTAEQQQHIHNWLTSNHDFITGLFQRGAESAAYVAARGVWLFAVPILAFFILRDGHYVVNEIIEALGRGRDQAEVKRILPQVDAMLGKYIRAQLALAGLSAVFYSVSMLLLGFPYAIALGVLGGALEFIPAVGWVASAVVILTIGFLTHAHWIWMAGLLVLWRLVQDYVNSPRIMGDSLELQPLTVIFALMVGGQLGGIAGLYLSVPAVAVLRIVWVESSSKSDSAGAISGQPLTQVEA
jgi:predicted PurR-regulated permease PerM